MLLKVSSAVFLHLTLVQQLCNTKAHEGHALPQKAKRRNAKFFTSPPFGREKVSVYKRIAPDGSPCFMVANYSTGKRRFDSRSTEAEAIEHATQLVRRMSERDVLSASMTREQSIEYAASIQTLKPLGIERSVTVATVAECLKLVGGLADIITACRVYATRHKPTVAKRLADAVTELLSVKAPRGASERYLRDLARAAQDWANSSRIFPIDSPQCNDAPNSRLAGFKETGNTKLCQQSARVKRAV